MAELKQYRPALAAFMLMMSMALTTTALSFFVEPVCAELGFGRGAFTVYYSIITAAGTLASPFLGQFIQRRGVRPVAAVSAVWVAAGLFGFSLCGGLPAFYLTAALTGLFGTACVTLCAGILVQTCYRGGAASRLTGLVMSGSGAGGMAVSLVLPKLITNYGWRTGYRLAALGWLILGLTAVLLLSNVDRGNGPMRQSATEEGITRAQALRSSKLWLLALAIFLLSGATGIQQHLPAVLSGFSTAQVSSVMSLFTAALALGKIAQGLVYGRIGPIRGGPAVIALYCAGFILLRLGAFVPGLLLLALGMGTVTTLMPILTRRAFGGKEYAAIWSILSAVSNLGAMTAAPLFGLAFDLTDSYGGAMIVAAVLLIPALEALTVVFRAER